jgi:hypothetical protein
LCCVISESLLGIGDGKSFSRAEKLFEIEWSKSNQQEKKSFAVRAIFDAAIPSFPDLMAIGALGGPQAWSGTVCKLPLPGEPVSI